MPNSTDGKRFELFLDDAGFAVPRIIALTLKRIGVTTIGELASLDEYQASKAYGIGVRKLGLIKELIQQAKQTLGVEYASVEPTEATLSDAGFDVPRIIAPTLKRIGVTTIGELASLDEYQASKAYGIGGRKLGLIKELIQQAKQTLGVEYASVEPTEATLSDAGFDVPRIIAPTLKRIGVTTIGELASLDEYQVSKAYGIGVRKLGLIKELIQQAKQTLGVEYASVEPTEATLSDAVAELPLLFVPSFLSPSFDRKKIKTVAKLLSLQGKKGWSPKKLELLTSLQSLYRRLQTENEFNSYTPVGVVVDECLLPDAQIGATLIEDFVSTELSDFDLSGRALSDAAALQRLFSKWTMDQPYFGNSELSNMDWRDVPLQLNKRAVDFVDKFRLDTLRALDEMATTGLVASPDDGQLVPVLEQDNFGGGTFQKLRTELGRLARCGLSEYRNGVICDLALLPPRDMAWRDVPLKISAWATQFFNKFELTTIEDVHRLAVRGQVKCSETGAWLGAVNQNNFSERSLDDLRVELMDLAAKGLDGYRYGGSGKANTVIELVAQIREFVNESEQNVLHLRCSGLTLNETADKIELTRERVRQIELTALAKCARFIDVARELLSPLEHTLKQEVKVECDQALGSVGAGQFWELVLIGRVADRSYHMLENQFLSRFSQRQLDALEMLVRAALRNRSLVFVDEHVSTRQLIEEIPNQKKWFVREWLSVADERDETFSTQELVKLIGIEWIQAHVRSQLVDAGINGLFFDHIDTAGVVKSPEHFVEMFGDEVDTVPDGRFRRQGKVYQRIDEIVEIVGQAKYAISAPEILAQSSQQWHQSHLVQYLSNACETIQINRGQYIHINKLSLNVRDVLAIASWGAGLLVGEKTQVDGEVLLDLYRHSDFDLPLDNVYQIVSIVAKHPDVRRAANNLRLAHKNTFDEAELFLAATDPDLAIQWHPQKNGKRTPDNVRPTSSKLFWWQCEAGHEFQVSVLYRTRNFRACPVCQGKWTVTRIRHFVGSLKRHLDSLTPAELYVIFQQSGLWQTGGKSRGFVKALATGRFPKTELDKFVNAEPSLVDEFLDDDEFELDQVTGNVDEETYSELQSNVDTNKSDDQPAASLPEVRTKKALTALGYVILASTDAEAAEFLVASAKTKIWNHAYHDELSAVTEAKEFAGGAYAEQVRSEFLNEYKIARELIVPDGYSFAIGGVIQEPNLMQRHVASEILVRKRYGNWSGTGAGKTLSAILGTRVANASLTIVFCPNAVVGENSDGWATEIVRVYPDSEVITKTLTPAWSDFASGHRYLVLNYEQLQQPESEARLKQLVESNRIDFIVIDEVHYAKQRYADQMSQRKRLLQAVVSAAGEINPDLRVLGLSATPVINNLQEGRSLVEMITGVEHDDLQVKPTVPNCMRLHQRLATLGTRWRPKYEAELTMHTVQVDCSEYLDEIRALGKNHSPLELEMILTHARLPAILERLSDGKKTLIYTYYVQGIDQILYNAITAAGHRVGFYTGQLKDGLDAFKAGSLDVLIGSSAIGTGVDGLQHCCNQLIVNVLPWTNAEYEQLIGRLWRQGQAAESVDVIVPTTFAEIDGERWSYCDTKLNRILYKKSIADAAVDGAVPEGNLRSPGQTQRDIMAWLERLESGEETTITRRKIVVPLSDDEYDSRKRLVRYGDFSKMNNRWNQTASGNLSERLSENPEEWEQYHTFYREARSKWTVVPVAEMISWCGRREGYVIGDFGCGEALLAKAVRDRHTVHSFDHIAIDESVIEGDMSHTPLDDESLDVAVYALSLMGSNFTDYLREAHRVLKIDGHLHIWEATSRFSDLAGFCASLEKLGFRLFPATSRGQFTHIEAQKTDQQPKDTVVLKM